MGEVMEDRHLGRQGQGAKTRWKIWKFYRNPVWLALRKSPPILRNRHDCGITQIRKTLRSLRVIPGIQEPLVFEEAGTLLRLHQKHRNA